VALLLSEDRMKRLIYILILLILISVEGVNAQQYSISSQYLTNGLVVNPAYAGSRGAMSVNLSYRRQWAQIKGAPEFENITLHTPVSKKEKVALGLMINRTAYGITKTTGIYSFYAYSIATGPGRLAFGLKGGLDITNANYGGANVIEPDDPEFTGSKSYSLPNLGAGVYYYTDKYFAGLSIPSFLSYHQSKNSEYSVYYNYKLDRIFFSGGGLLDISESFKIKPSFLLRYSFIEPLEMDLNANLIFGNILWLGGSYRIAEKAVVALVDLQVTPQLRVGYSYDYPAGHLNSYTTGTHEISIRYEFEFKVSAASPRYF
jgi:type IX secretion system PorP/SprF family membrane protein